MRFGDITQAIGNTPLVGLPRLSPHGRHLYLKLEGQNPTGSGWDRSALSLMREAERAGRLRPGQHVLESAVGDFAIALAAVCRGRGHPLTCVMPEDTSEVHRRIVTMFGADVVLSPGSEGPDGALRVAREMAAADSDLCIPSRAGDALDALVHHETTAPEIIADLPDVAAFVGGTGASGAVTGVGRRLKRWNPDIKVFAVESAGDDLLGGSVARAGGRAEGPDLAVLDGRFVVDPERALELARRLAAEEGVIAGASTGAALSVAFAVCADLPEGSKVVVLSPDGGWRQLATGVQSPLPA